VLKALLEHQIEYFDTFSRKYMADHGSTQPEPHLAVQIATLREAVAQPRSVAFAILGAMAQEPSLLSITREADARTIKAIKAEAADPELATLRWMAARGLALTTLFGMCPLSEEEREQLFDRLLDARQWSRSPATTQRSGTASPARNGKRRTS
jgi:hypothetical protein